jgi:hypothetical protein
VSSDQRFASWWCIVLAGAIAVVGCADRRAVRDSSVMLDGATPDDAASDVRLDDGTHDGSSHDGSDDGSSGDTGPFDTGPFDTGPFDAGPMDTGPGPVDTGPPDTGPPDTGSPDTAPPDTAPPDTAPPTGGCISGATGTHVLRFRWEGSTSGGTAHVVYEANTLPDTSRWHVGAYSSSIGYTPVFRDPFLGEGGLDLSGTVFIDVQLSTEFLSSVVGATLSIYGRSFNTTTSGSFTWQTFSGTGASPHGGVSNSAPYEWYPADATLALPAGDDGTLLRIRPGPPSNALIVRRVEVCFDAR